jgi:hypothetical protein
LQALRAKYAATGSDRGLDVVLDRSGCLDALRG